MARRGTGVWQKMWAKAPRRLRATTAGRILLALTLACGLLALNSGNNLLFFVWGMMLGAIVVSGVLSEASLRPLTLEAELPPQARVGERCSVQLRLGNASRFVPAFAVQALVRLQVADLRMTAHAPFCLRLSPASKRRLHASFVPLGRGRWRCKALLARTGYPFGLFVKDRRFAAPTAEGLVWPERVEVGHLIDAVATATGEAPAGRAGRGEDFFALRPFRAGDAPSRVLWRRAAGGRPLLVREEEATQSAQLTLVLQLAYAATAPSTAVLAARERTLALCGSLAEALLLRGYAVGLLTHGAFVACAAAGPLQRRRLLDALAALDLSEAMPQLPYVAEPSGPLQLCGLAAAATPSGYPALHLAGRTPP